MQKEYLRITLHDNDFTSYYQTMGDTLSDIFRSVRTYPTEEDLPQIKELVTHLWYSIHNIRSLLRWKNTPISYDEAKIDCFLPDISIVSDIPEWENNEVLYIPLFDGDAGVILR